MRRVATPFAAVALASTTYAAGHVEGSYEKTQWPLLGLGVVGLVWLLACAGRRPQRLVLVSATALVALGCWTAASPLWGGLPDVAWSELDAALLAAGALVAGTLFGPRHADLISAGVAAGLAAQAVDVLGETAAHGIRTGWFYGRTLDGPVGYHNAQGALFAVGLPLAVRHLGADDRRVRVAGALAAVPLAAALLLTQSRGALAAATAALILQVVLTRSARVLVAVASVATAAAVLVIPLRSVDAALVNGTPGNLLGALQSYALATLCCTVACAAVAVTRVHSLGRLRIPHRSAVAVIALGVVVGILATAGASRSIVSRAVEQVRSDAAPDPRPGETRLVSLSLNGRLEAWHVAAHGIRSDPILGAGAGQYTARWIKERHTMLYLLQPHSIELELASEEGAVGLALFLAFVLTLLAATIRSCRRPAAAAAAAAVVALLAEASVDWTWSFPGLVVPVLFVAGSVAGSARAPRRLPLPGLVAASTLLVAAAILFGAPYASALAARKAAAAEVSNPSVAARAARWSLSLDPWTPEVLELEARLAASRGAYPLAARRYERAATLSQHAWLDHFLAAGMFARTDSGASVRRTCEQAATQNPLEPLIRGGACAPAAS